MYIAETGWPTKSSDPTKANNGMSDASIPNLQTFLETFVCPSNTNNIPYFYFETFDEPWKVGFSLDDRVTTSNGILGCPIRWCGRMVGHVQL